MIEQYLFQPNPKEEEHIIATYSVTSDDLIKAAKSIAIGQSIGNPEKRTHRDSVEIFKNNLAKIVDVKPILQSHPFDGIVTIAYPVVNFDIYRDGITQLLCTLMGGQMDIDSIEACRLEKVQFPKKVLDAYAGPKFGMENIKTRAKAEGRPLLGGIIKPKTGINVSQLEEMVQEMLDGGVDFIKEDEILGNPYFCPFEERVERIADLVNNFSEKENREIFYTPCINGDYPYFLERAKFASEKGMRAVHLNVWAGFPAYKALRDLDLPNTAIFFQKSGDKVITSEKNPYSISWNVTCQLARMIGVDFIHAGMWGGYMDDSKKTLDAIMGTLRNHSDKYKATIPSLSCGSHPGLVDTTVHNYGDGLMMNVGGAMQGHPFGTEAGAKAMRQAMSKPLNENMYEFMQDKPELKSAIEKWGYTDPVSGTILYKK